MEDNSSDSSVATGLPQASFLQRTLERLSSTQSLKVQAEEAAPVAVIALQRYLSEQTDGQQPQSYSYDVTVTDGVWRAKCFLHGGLNNLVHSNTLRTGTDISITQCSFVYNERILGHGYICIEKIRCGAQTSAVLPRIKDVNSLPMLVKHGMERSVLLQSDVPLQVSRKHYLSLWNTDDPEGDVWTSGPPSSGTVLDGETRFYMYFIATSSHILSIYLIIIYPNILFSTVSKIALLRSLESSFKNTWWKPLPLLVKIIHKSRLRYYGKSGLNPDFPYQVSLTYRDSLKTRCDTHFISVYMCVFRRVYAHNIYFIFLPHVLLYFRHTLKLLTRAGQCPWCFGMNFVQSSTRK